MLKSLVMLAALVFIVIGVSGQPNKTPSLRQQDAKPGQMAIHSPDSQNKQSSGQADQTKAGSNTPTGNTPIERSHWWPKSEWWVVIIAGLTGCVIGWQSWETRKSAQAGREAANAALLNAQAVINAERPWIVVTVEAGETSMGGFTIHAKNQGRTPALIIEARMGCVAVENIAALPGIAPCKIGSFVENRIVISDQTVFITWFSEKTLKNVLQEDFPQFSWDGQIFVFGKILYRDLLNPSPNLAIHETRWICQYLRSQGESGNEIFQVEGVGVGEEYEKYT